MKSEKSSIERRGSALRAVVQERASAGAAPLTFAMVYPFSCHHYELRYWLAASGIDPDNDIRLVVMPPPFMVDALRERQIDGFCAGEPWNTLAVESGIASIATVTTAIWRRSPEKVSHPKIDIAFDEAPRHDVLRGFFDGRVFDPRQMSEYIAAS